MTRALHGFVQLDLWKGSSMREVTAKKRAKLDLGRFEKKIRVRRWRKKDFDAIVEMQRLCFPEMHPWTLKQYTDFSVSWFFAVNTRVSGQHPMKSIIFQQVANMSFQEVGRPEGDIRDFVPRLTWFETQAEPYMELLAHMTVFEIIDLYTISWGIHRRPA